MNIAAIFMNIARYRAISQYRMRDEYRRDIHEYRRDIHEYRRDIHE